MTLNWKSLVSLLTLVASGAVFAHNDPLDDSHENVMLLGSELRICSSMNSDYCANTHWINANEMRTTRLFQLTDVRRRAALRPSLWPRERESVREEVDEMLREMVDYFARGVVPEHRLVERLRSRAYLDLLLRLSEAEYNRILDNLEMPRLEGLNEVVNLDASRDYSADFVRQFVRLTARLHGIEGTRAPRILLVTAGERDTFRSLDSHLQAFAQAGAHATWLPLDLAVTQAQETMLCSDLDALRQTLSSTYDRARVHPIRHAEQLAFCRDLGMGPLMLQDADAIFFTGGSADRLRNALISNNRPSALLLAMRARFAAGTLAIGGAGEGAAALVHANMITHGHSREAILAGALARRPPPLDCDLDDTCPRDMNAQSFTYEPLGGLGFLTLGILDTDVAHQGRQARMLRLAATTGTPFSIGIDRDTALELNAQTGAFSISGRDGVFMLEDAQGNESMLAASFHYLRSGTHGYLSAGRLMDVDFAPQSFVRPTSPTTRFLGDSGLYDNLDLVCRNDRQLRLLQDRVVLILQLNEASELELSRGRCQIINGVIGIAKQ